MIRVAPSWPRVSGCLAAFLAFAIAGSVRAGTSYQDPGAFDLALPGIFRNLDYDARSPGTLLPIGAAHQGISLGYTLDGATAKVVDTFDTTSPANSVGLDGGDDALLDGDAVTISFSPHVRAIGLFVITSDPAAVDEILLSTPTGSIGNAAAPLSVNPDGGHVYFLGRIEGTTFAQANLSFAADGEVNFVYNVDDLTTAVEAVSTWVFSGTAAGDGTVSFAVNGIALTIPRRPDRAQRRSPRQ